MGMFGMFGKKKVGFDPATGEWGSDNVGMMKMLAGMPHVMRPFSMTCGFDSVHTCLFLH